MLGESVLGQVQTVDSVPLVISREISPEVILFLHCGVFQCTGPTAEQMGAGNTQPWKVHQPIYYHMGHPFPCPSPPAS